MAGKQKLTAKQERFVAEYLIDLNATQAAIRAGSFVLNGLTGPSQAKIGRGRAPRAARLDEISKRSLNIYKIN